MKNIHTAFALAALICFLIWLLSRWWRAARRRWLLEATLKQLWRHRNAGDHAAADALLARYKEIAASQ